MPFLLDKADPIAPALEAYRILLWPLAKKTDSHPHVSTLQRTSGTPRVLAQICVEAPGRGQV
jgi:hypothetical protein